MKLNTFAEAVTDYERLTGETFEWKVGYEDLKVLPSNDFMTWRIGEKEGIRYFEMRQTYGWLKNFIPWIKEVMKKNNLEWIVTMTTRNPKAHMRKWKMERLEKYDYEFEGRKYYVLLGHIDNLKG